MDNAESGSSGWQDLVPLDPITTHLPSHYQHGLQTSPLVLTGVSSFEDHLVLSTNVGLIFLAHLPSLQVVRLKCERSLSCITCTSATRSVDDMIAAGSSDGCISVFLLPRLLAPVHAAPRAGLGQDLKRFSVSSLHTAPVTSLAWSSNGLRLVSGDATGVVGLLEVDHDCCQCIARHLFSEGIPITQLSYWKQRVAASTEERCVVYSLQTEELSVVGTKPRKQKGRFGVAWSRRGLKDSVAGGTDGSVEAPVLDDDTGASGSSGAHTKTGSDAVTSPGFGTGNPCSSSDETKPHDHFEKPNETCIKNSEKGSGTELKEAEASNPIPCSEVTSSLEPNLSTQPRTPIARQISSAAEESALYTSRPGQRVWVAQSSGLVHTTLLIKDLPNSARINVPSANNSQLPSVIKFENIQVLDTGQLVIYSEDTLLIFNPITLLVEAFLHNDNFIRDVSFTKSSIFILSKAGKVFCLSCEPTKIGSSAILRSVRETQTNSRSTALLSPAAIKKFGLKMYSQSSSVLDSVVKLGGTIASRVSETASRDTIITGISEEDFMSGRDASLYASSDRRFFSNYHLSGADLNTATKQSLVPCTMTQSVAGTLPASHLPESPESESLDQRMTQSLCNFLESAQLPNSENNEAEEDGLLVVRGRPGRRRNRRPPKPSPGPGSERGSKSPSQHRQPETDTPSPPDGPVVTDSTAKVPNFSVEETERKLGEMLGIECLKNSGSPHDNKDSDSSNDQTSRVGRNTINNFDDQGGLCDERVN